MKDVQKFLCKASTLKVNGPILPVFCGNMARASFKRKSDIY